MLSIADPRLDRHCQGLARREFLKIGALGGLGALGGVLTLPQLLAAKAAGSSVVRDKSVVLLFLSGGPSHIEFFDPKMSAPAEYRSVTGELPTKHAGITFGGTFPQLAARADQFSIVRSYGSGNSGHTYESVTTGGNSLKSALSAIYARVAGVNHPQTGIPNNILLLPEAVKENLKIGSNFETGALPTLTQHGDLGPSYNAFNPAGGGQLKDNLELKVPAERLLDRRNLLAGLDRMKRDAERTEVVKGASEFQQQALDVITRGVAQAFDLKQESAATLERYNTEKLFPLEEVQRWSDMKRSTNLLGKQMLLARRLCEAGCGFVTVSDCGWDMQPLGTQVDHAVSAFIDDVRERGLQDKILLVVTGEMGRTPRINNNGGRDHYGDLTPLLLFGGGLKMGQVIGQSDGKAERASTKPFRPQNLMITIMNVLFDMGLLRLQTNIPRDIAKLGETAEPIEGLL